MPIAGTKYCNINEVLRDWNIRNICVEFPDGSDALLQENGYTKEDALKFAGQGASFFYDD